MSRVYSFRLNLDNQREAQAKAIIDHWIEKGYSIRFILTDALIKYSNNDKTNDDIEEVFIRVQEILNQLEISKIKKTTEEHDSISLSTSFMAAIRNSARTGLTLK